MVIEMEGTIDFPSEFLVKTDLGEIEFDKNVSFVLPPNYDNEVTAQSDPNYEQFLADVWVGIILTLMVLSCVCCMCSCLLYHKFQQWKRSVIQARNAANVEAGTTESELPSYTIASGLPSYEEALEQLKKVKELSKVTTSAKTNNDNWVPHTPPTPLHTLSVKDLFQIYTNKNSDPECNSCCATSKTNS